MRMEKVKIGQRWSNTTRFQIIEIISKGKEGFWYKIIEQKADNKFMNHQKNEDHINRLYTLIC